MVFMEKYVGFSLADFTISSYSRSQDKKLSVSVSIFKRLLLLLVDRCAYYAFLNERQTSSRFSNRKV
ncbi:hypothetical protein GCM10007094_33760 [Pseudovibrio japonicus]|uniref:Uncharacterized protein n=1 Tax=Pseudovibrio japonicus TaxID=366534 RepID=A0ABQ3EIW4_9HYPH|nr:hypothetical protein GCM10007094_33760 [Pseudovibrio japonicus]